MSSALEVLKVLAIMDSFDAELRCGILMSPPFDLHSAYYVDSSKPCPGLTEALVFEPAKGPNFVYLSSCPH